MVGDATLEEAILSMEVVAVVISFLALGFAVYSFARQFRLQRRVASIEEARREDELAARLVADVTAFVSRERREDRMSTDYRLVLFNRGPAVARDVDVELDAGEGKAPELRKEDHAFPMTLDVEQQYDLYLEVTFGMSPNFRASLRWEDGRGPRSKALTLTL
jgi:hypothetical protein